MSKQKTEEAKEPEKEASEQAPEQKAEENPLKVSLEKALADAEDYKRKWYFVSAEYENYRKRTATQSASRYAEGRADVVKGLFPIADDLGRALESCSDEKTRDGLRMVIRSFERLLEEEKIAVIDPAGQPFDAEKHEAILAVEPKEGEESGTVRDVFRKGYEQNGKVLRFAQVSVVK